MLETQVETSFIEILTGSELSKRRIPYMVARGSSSGPVLWLTACCHGEEVGGIVVVQEVFRRIERLGFARGCVHAFPLMNPLGFEVASRRISLSDEDLNRAFPGHPDGTFAQRLAFKIFSSIIKSKPDFVVDLHNDWIRSIPYAVLDAKPTGQPYSASQSGGSADGAAPYSELTTAPRVDNAFTEVGRVTMGLGINVVEEPKPIRHTLSHVLIAHGVPALTFELGESYVVNEDHVTTGVESVWRLMTNLGMFENDFSRRTNTQAQSGKLQYCQTRATKAGIIRFLVGAGERVTKGQPVANVVSVFGTKREVIVSPGNGVVLGISDSSVAFPGALVMAFGVRTDRARHSH